MTECPKCGSNRITTPRYEKKYTGAEFLRYICITCGYSITTPTKDNQKYGIPK